MKCYLIADLQTAQATAQRLQLRADCASSAITYFMHTIAHNCKRFNR